MLENCNGCSLCKVALVRCYNVLADRESRVSTYVEFSDRIKLIKCLRKQFSCRVRLISGCLQPTQLSWLPVLSNVASPSLHCKEATDNTLQIIEAHPNWPCVCWMSLSIHLHGLHLDAQYGHIWHRRHNYAVEGGIVVGFCGQPHYCYRPYYPTARFQPPSSYMVSDELFPDRSRMMRMMMQSYGWNLQRLQHLQNNK